MLIKKINRIKLQQHKNRTPFYISIILGLIFLSLGSFAQSENESENHDTKKLDKLLINYNKDQDKVLADAEKIHQDSTGELSDKELGSGPVVDPDAPVLKKAELGMFDSAERKKAYDASHKKTNYAESLRVALGPLQKMSEPELVQLLKDNTSGTKTRLYIDRFPTLALFTVRLIKDKNALPNLGAIVDEETQLVRFGGIMIATILFGLFLKRLMKGEGRSIPKAVAFWFLRFFIMTSIRFALLLYFFSDELSPIFKIMEKTFF